MAFVIIRILDVSGLLALIGTGLGPVMGIFGLPVKPQPFCSVDGCPWAVALA